MRAAVQVTGLCSGFLGWICAIASLQVQSWRMSTDDESAILTSDIYENLWMSCALDSTGIINCWYYPSLLALPGYIQACRALMITSIVLGTLGLIFTLVGMQCSKIGGQNYVLKGRIAALGGAIFILQGLCTMTAVTWYASSIIQEFFDPLYPGIKYEPGEGLYIGWCSVILALIGGCCLLCACRKSKDNDVRDGYKSPSRIDVISPLSPSHSSQHRYSSYV